MDRNGTIFVCYLLPTDLAVDKSTTDNGFSDDVDNNYSSSVGVDSSSPVNYQGPTGLPALSDPPLRPFADLYNTITGRVVVVTCVFGILGNMAALALLLRRRRRVMATSQRTPHSGGGSENRAAQSDINCFIALFLSDLCFCAILLPHWHVDYNVLLKTKSSFLLYYELYEDALVNTFVLSSTWLTVSMTTNRYLHLSHPMCALRVIGGSRFLSAAIGISIGFSIVFNVPRYWLREIRSVACMFPENTTVYYLQEVHTSWESAYQWTYFVVGISVPLLSLAYCNVCIICTICRSVAIEQSNRNRERNLITTTLVFVVLFYISLVSPAELLRFFEPAITQSAEGVDPYLLINAVANLMQAVNFSCNFIPYLILDKSVRQSCPTVISRCCRLTPKIKRSQTTRSSAENQKQSVHFSGNYKKQRTVRVVIN